MKSDFSGLKISEAMRSLFSETEQKKYIESGDYSALALAQLYISRLHLQGVAAPQLDSSYDLSQLSLSYLKLFFPSSVAKRSFLYLQSLIAADFGESYFTDRTGLASYLLVQTTGGKGLLRYGGREYLLTKGDVFFIDCMQHHRYQTAAAEGWAYRLIHFLGAPMSDFFRYLSKAETYVFHFEENSAFTQLFEEVFQRNKADDPGCEIDTHCLLTRLVTMLISDLPLTEGQALPSKIKEIQEWVTEHCTEPLTIDHIARRFSISKYHLCHEYKKYTGQTVFETVLQERLTAAKKLLVYSELSVRDISDYTGFSDQTSFGRAFKKAEGLTPTAFRRQWKEF